MPAERDFVAGVIQLANLFTRRMAPIFGKARITPQQWTVLATIAENDGPTTLAALARSLLVSKQNMTGMIARLQQLGLAERDDDPNDLRSSRVTLTRRGKTLVDKLRPSYEEWIRVLAKEIGERDLQTLTRTVEKLLAQLESPQ